MKLSVFTSACGELTLLCRTTATLMIPLLLITSRPVLAAADNLGANSESGTSYPTPVLTPTDVKVNRTAPDVTPPAKSFSFSAEPSDAEIFSGTPFEEPLIPIGAQTTPDENKALAGALLKFQKRSVRDDFSALEAFLGSYPNSAWKISLLTNLGSAYLQTGYYSKALVAWNSAWTYGKSLKASPSGKVTIDRALAELIVMNARVGRMDALNSLINESNDRHLSGSSKERVESAKQALILMQKHPETSFRCGPMAVEKLRNMQDGNDHSKWKLKSDVSTQEGTSLAQLSRLAAKLSLGLQTAKRISGSAIIVPSVVHWKVGHFAAAIGFQNGLVHLQDPTFGNDVWMTPTALDEEASGYFLVKNQKLPTGWQPVSTAEAAKIWGKGTTTGCDINASGGPNCRTCHPDSNPDELLHGQYYDWSYLGNQDISANDISLRGSVGMAKASIYEMLASLCVKDTPLFYLPPVGPSVQFCVTYSQREANQPSLFTYSNLGPLWTFGWLSYLTDDPTNPGANVNHYLSGGGTLTYTGFNSSTQTYAPDPQTSAVLKITSSTTYELDLADGSKQIFSAATSTVPRKVFMTKNIDPQGNFLLYTYDSNYRLVSVNDAIGQVTTLTYGLTSDIYKITKVTDPFGRFANFAYTPDGNLSSSTDEQGLVSSYLYQSEYLESMTTPYGTSNFSLGQDANKRWVQTTDPQGGQERVETWDNVNPSVSDDGGTVPTGEQEFGFSVRNTFYWNKKAMIVAPGNYSQAQVIQWLHEAANYNLMSGQVEASQSPLDARVFYNYPSQPAVDTLGSSGQPNRVVSILNDGSTPESDYQYNSLNQVTQVKDPLNRVTNYSYATNNIDLVGVTQNTQGGADTLFSASYNTQHEPLTTTDAAGQTTHYNYNSNGQIHTITNAKSEITTYGYNSSFYLTSVTDNATGGSVSFTYDSFGRIRTITDLNGYVLTYDYDNLNRVTKITYPDGTFCQNVYVNLDLTLSKDRVNRWTRNFYNAAQQVVGIEDPQGRLTNYERCACGELKSIVDSGGHRTSWTTDIEGRTLLKTFPDATTIGYSYDTGGRLSTVLDAKGQTTSYFYFPDSAPSLVRYTGGGLSEVEYTFAYDTYYPRLTKMVDYFGSTGTTQFGYCPPLTLGAGQVQTETGALGSTAAITYGYDQLGRSLSTSINGVTSSVVYDSLGRVTGATNPLATFTYAYYGATPRLQAVTNNQNGLNTSYSYQSGAGQDFRLTDITNNKTGTTVLSKFDYTYNPVGTIATWQQQTDSNTPTQWKYGYDGADQLLNATRINTSTQAVISQYVYGYDLAGNRNSEQIGLSVVQASYNNLNQRSGANGGGPLQFSGTLSEPAQVTVGGQTATYGNYYSTNFTGMANVTAGTNTVAVVARDVNGNASTNKYQVVVPTNSATTLSYDFDGNESTSGNGQAYNWDAKNELTSIVYSSGSNSGNHTEFTYDGFGRRVKIVERTGTIINSGTITSTKQFVWIGNRIAEERDASNNVTKRFFNQGQQIGGVNYYYSRDHLGSIREMLDNASNIQARYDYDPYGRVTKVSGSLDADFRYAGMYVHPTSQVSLTKYRAYDPNGGNWLSRDPIAENGGINLYGYVGNDPINHRDRSGLYVDEDRIYGDSFSREAYDYWMAHGNWTAKDRGTCGSLGAYGADLLNDSAYKLGQAALSGAEKADALISQLDTALALADAAANGETADKVADILKSLASANPDSAQAQEVLDHLQEVLNNHQTNIVLPLIDPNKSVTDQLKHMAAQVVPVVIPEGH